MSDQDFARRLGIPDVTPTYKDYIRLLKLIIAESTDSMDVSWAQRELRQLEKGGHWLYVNLQY